MFVDEITIKAIAGKGGDGCTSFRREKYVPMGGPDGGNGGKGSDIVFVVEKGLKTLIDLRYMKTIKGDKGTNGMGSTCNGAGAKEIIVKVPLGTTLTDADTDLILADLIHEEDRFVVAHGGRGGRGNKAFATHNEPAPKMSEYGEPGEERLVKCELKMLADVGLVGMPSVGKSSFLALISASKPKIASYHFTTLNPNLGVIKLKDHRDFVIADLPGLIEGASEGVGLGHKFLKHAMRTKIIAHVIDMGSFEGRDPIQDYETIRNEMVKYSDILARKKEIILANKMDLPDANKNLELFKNKYPNLDICEISVINGTGINESLIKTADLLDQIADEPLYDQAKYESHIIYKFQNEKPYIITKDNDIWVIKGPEIEKLFKMTKFGEDESILRFGRKLRGLGIENELEKLGAKRGDEVQIMDYMFLFKE